MLIAGQVLVDVFGIKECDHTGVPAHGCITGYGQGAMLQSLTGFGGADDAQGPGSASDSVSHEFQQQLVPVSSGVQVT